MFIAEMMLCLIPQVLRLLKMKCSLSKRPGCFLIKVRLHDFAFSTRLMNFSIVPAILCSFEIIAKTLSVALEVSLSIYTESYIHRTHTYSTHYKTNIYKWISKI